MKRYHGNKVFVDYLYVDHTRLDVCVKTKVLNFETQELKDIPWGHASVWELKSDEHSSFNNIGSLREKLLKPVAVYNDPFREGRHKMVLCDVMEDAGNPTEWSFRDKLIETVRRTNGLDILMGYEQEYYMYGDSIHTELSVERIRVSYHDQVGLVKKTSTQRTIAEDHINACLTAGLCMYGFNREKARGQWEYQLGPSDPITLADHTVISRYLLKRVAEMHNAEVTFDPFPAEHPFPSSLQLNFSTKEMRENGGLKAIKDTLHTLSQIPQEELVKHYDRHGGRQNAARLIGGKHVPSPAFKVGWGVKDSALRVSTNVIQEGRGYFEERRPSSDCDPYELAYVFIKAAVFKELP